jgi:hypothetical protein
MVMAVTMFSCGGGSGGGGSKTPQELMDDSRGQLDSLLSEVVAECIESLESGQESCPCSGGGNIMIGGEPGNLLFDGCKNEEGYEFSGTMTRDDGGVAITMDVFGDCTDATGEGLEQDVCTGTITAKCEGHAVTCVQEACGGECCCND